MNYFHVYVIDFPSFYTAFSVLYFLLVYIFNHFHYFIFNFGSFLQKTHKCKSSRSRQELSNEYLVFICEHRFRYSRERALQSLVQGPYVLPLLRLDSFCTAQVSGARCFPSPGSYIFRWFLLTTFFCMLLFFYLDSSLSPKCLSSSRMPSKRRCAAGKEGENRFRRSRVLFVVLGC